MSIKLKCDKNLNVSRTSILLKLNYHKNKNYTKTKMTQTLKKLYNFKNNTKKIRKKPRELKKSSPPLFSSNLPPHIIQTKSKEKS